MALDRSEQTIIWIDIYIFKSPKKLSRQSDEFVCLLFFFTPTGHYYPDGVRCQEALGWRGGSPCAGSGLCSKPPVLHPQAQQVCVREVRNEKFFKKKEKTEGRGKSLKDERVRETHKKMESQS